MPESDVPQTAVYEWTKELDRVKNKFEEEQKMDPSHYMTHIIRMQHYFKKIKNIMQKSGNIVLQNFVYICESALDKISASEKRLNMATNQEILLEMSITKEKRTKTATELIELRNKVKELIDQFDQILEEYNAVSVFLIL